MTPRAKSMTASIADTAAALVRDLQPPQPLTVVPPEVVEEDADALSEEFWESSEESTISVFSHTAESVIFSAGIKPGVYGAPSFVHPLKV